MDKVNFDNDGSKNQQIYNQNEEAALIAWGQAVIAEYKYSKMYNNISFWVNIINVISYCFPILITAVLLAASNQDFQYFFQHKSIIEQIGVIGSALVFVIPVVFFWVFKFDSNLEAYKEGMLNNLRNAKDAKEIYQNKEFDKLKWFYNYLHEQDKKDKIYLKSDDKRVEKAAYTHWLETSGQNCILCKKESYALRPNTLQRIFKQYRICTKCGSLDVNKK